MFDPWYLLVAMITSSIGIGVFIYGKRNQEPKPLFIGALMVGVSYFVANPVYLTLVFLALTAVLASNQIQHLLTGTTGSTFRQIEERPSRSKDRSGGRKG